MPDEYEGPLVIPITDETRRALFYDLRIEERIAHQGEEMRTVVAEYYECLKPFEVPEDATIESVYEVRTSRGENRYPFIPIEVAKVLFSRSTDGRGTLDVYGQNNRLYDVKMRGRLDIMGWQQYITDNSRRPQIARYDQTVEGEALESVYIEDLRVWVQWYEQYRAARTSYLRSAIRNARGLAYEEEDATALAKVRSGAGDFHKFMRNMHDRLVVEQDPFGAIRLLPHGTLSSRKWGIEIEAVYIDNIQTPEFWVLKGDGSLRSIQIPAVTEHTDDCNSLLPPGCDCGACQNDCDCSASRGGTSRTGEWNSPPLRSFHSRGLEYLCSELEDRPSNDSPGIHVHVAADDLTPEQAAKVVLIYTALEPLFQDLYNRASRSYCEAIDSRGVIDRIKKLKEHQKKNGSKSVRSAQAGDRYVTVNLQALRSHGTIEFRAMGPTYNYDHLIKWAYLLREIINLAKSNAPQKSWASVKTFKDLIAVFAKYGKETPTPEWVKAQPEEKDVVALLGVENRRLPNKSREEGFPIETVLDDYTARDVVASQVNR